jgi:hypothetical protein
VLGVVFRETSRPALAESRLRSAVEIAVAVTCPLTEAKARRDLAELHWRLRRRPDAVAELVLAHELFARLGARIEMLRSEGRLAEIREG